MPGPFGSPFDEIMAKHSLKNDDLVWASSEQLTFKQVQKARKGKPLTQNIQGKIVRALNAALGEEKYDQKKLWR